MKLTINVRVSFSHLGGESGREGLRVGKAGGEREWCVMGKVMGGQSGRSDKGGSRGRLGNGEREGKGKAKREELVKGGERGRVKSGERGREGLRVGQAGGERLRMGESGSEGLRVGKAGGGGGNGEGWEKGNGG